MPANGSVTSIKTRLLNGKKFTFIKFVDQSGNVNDIIFNEQGELITEEALPAVQQSKIGTDLQHILDKNPSDPDYIPNDADIKVVIALIVNDEKENNASEFGSATIKEIFCCKD